jgi:uncharacterized protein YjcR
MTDLLSKLKAYYLFLKGYDQLSIATACGVTSRTIRNWIRAENWAEDQRLLEGLVRGIVLAELVSAFHASQIPGPPEATPARASDLPNFPGLKVGPDD